MADETTTFLKPDHRTTDPVILPSEENQIEQHVEQDQEPLPARHRLRAFEDEVLGKDAVRISGGIEKGHGSHFKTKLTEEQRRHHEALEHLVATEEKLAKASAHLAVAEVEHKAAEEKVAQAAEAADRHEHEHEREEHVDG
jgi:hypothetical protein